MPYPCNSQLPNSVKATLPDSAQDIYRSAFNRAWRSAAAATAVSDASERRRTEAARRVAWAAVCRRYENVGGTWQRKH